MKVLCKTSHERPMGVVYRAGQVYDLENPSPAYFVPVEEETPEAEPEKPKKGGKRK
ncbi:MAG: hypothetical protein PHE72_14780 [candidate division Zixibacteria bacterium]|nr:hypothetical protein [candidate division Zixibacteria bacterium]